MGSLGTLAASLKLDGGSQMRAGLASVGSAASSLTSSLSAIQGPLALLGVSFGAFKSLQGVTESLKGVFAAGQQLQTLSRAMGESVGNLKMMQTAFSAAGLSAEEMPNALRAMQRAIGGVNDEGVPTNATIARLGVSMAKLKTMSPVDEVKTLLGAIGKMPDTASQGAAAMNLWGREGLNMLAIARDPDAMAGLSKGMSATAAIFQRDAATFAKITADLNIIGGKTKGFFVGVADEIGPVLLPLLDKLKAVDLVPLGQQAGHAIRMIAAAFEQGRTGELFAASLEIGIGQAINYFAGAMAPIAQAFSKLFGGQLDALANSFGPLVDGICGLLEAGLLRAFTTPVRYLQASVEAILQQQAINKAQSEGKKMDVERYGNMTPEALQRRIAQLEKALRSDGNTSEQATFFQGQLTRAKAYQADPSQFIPIWKSLKEIMDQHANEPVRVGAGAGRSAVEIERDARADLKSVAPIMAKGGGDIMETIRAMFAGFRSANIIDVGASTAKLTALLGQLKGIGDAADGAPPKLGGVGLGLTGTSKAVEGDRLARIGGFIGGAGGPALDFARRTAVGVEKTHSAIQTLTQHFGGAVNRDFSARWA